MPFTPDAKSPGDLIRSADWNEAMTEIVRLETDKVNNAGDTMTGPLSVGSSLTIEGDPAAGVSSSVFFQTENNTNPGARIGTVGSGGTGNAGDLLFTTNGIGAGAEKMRLTTTGRLGIGTNNPQTRLHVTGNVTTDWGLTINHFNPSFAAANQTRPWLHKAWNGTLSDYLTLSSTGNRSNTEQSAMILAGNSISFGRGHDNGDQLSTEWLRIDTDGNMGIGINDPAQRLDVGGSVQLTGSLYCKAGSEESTNTRLYKGYYGLIAADGRTRFNLTMDHNPDLATNPYSFGVGHTFFTSGQFFFWGTDYKFRVDSDGRVYADTSFSGGGADYADLFESHNEKEIAPGTAVVLTNEGKVRKAKKNETPIGVITKNPSILGNNPMDWHQKYLKDEFGNKVMEKMEEEVPVSEEAEAQLQAMSKSKLKTKAARKGLTKITKVIRPKLNPEYDPEREYIPRVNRPEWQAVGLIGQLPLIKGQPVAPNWIKIKDISDKVELWLVR